MQMRARRTVSVFPLGAPRAPRALTLAAGALLSLTQAALAGGGPDNVLIIIDPSSPDSLYLGNYYKNARNIPDANVLYIDPDAANYPAFAGTQLPGFLGNLTQRRIDDHIDYVVVTPGNSFFVSAPGLITDGCFPVGRFSIGSVFGMAFIKNEILAGLPSTTSNRYFSNAVASPLAFDSNLSWLGGQPSTDPAARRYFIGALLGYTGANGNTVDEIRQMIDRSVQADGTRPVGTVHYMNNTGDPIRNVRACGTSSCAGPTPLYTLALTNLSTFGSAGQILTGALPPGPGATLGVMSGFSNADIAGMNMTIVPGAFSDHLTSFACTFDDTGQTKASEWIRKGASGSAGTVDEPCNYPGKFNTASLHVFYVEGMSMGEAYLRTLGFTPFQQLFLGDPVTRAFTHIPAVTVPNAPTGVVSGTVQFTPVASTTHPVGAIFSLDLLIDGVVHSTASPGSPFTIKTGALADGRHDLRVRAFDNTFVKSVGRWTGTLDVNNFGRSCSLAALPAAGNLSTSFTLTPQASGGTVSECRVLHNGRVIAASPSAAPMTIRGQMLGAGPVHLVLETEFTDGRRALSTPVTLNIDTQNPATAPAVPTAFSYRRTITRNAGAAVVELPSSFNTTLADATYTIITQPAQATLAGSGAWRVLTPNPGACGPDSFQFRVQNTQGQSGIATVTLRYALPTPACPADFNTDGQLTIADFGAFQAGFVAQDPRADFNGDCTLTIADFGAFQSAFVAGCP